LSLFSDLNVSRGIVATTFKLRWNI